jgi:uncharacterized membrane protein (UPF0127 family)
VRITNQTKGTELASDARVARSYWSRLVGLLGKRSLPAGQALVIEPCTSVHTAFMRFAIDVLYVDPSRRVVKSVAGLKPFRVSGVLRGRCSVVELPSGAIAASKTVPGDQLSFDA